MEIHPASGPGASSKNAYSIPLCLIHRLKSLMVKMAMRNPRQLTMVRAEPT